MIDRRSGGGDRARYAAYTVDLSSPIELPGFGLSRTRSRPAVRIEYGSVDSGVDDVAAGVVRLSYEGIGRFEVRDGRRVLIDPSAGVSDASLRRYLVGPVIAVVLHQRGYLVLHASTVSIRGAGVALLGPSGAGKSTLAAACHAQGYPLLSDDITAVRVVDGVPVVTPGPPVVKLHPDTAAGLGRGFERLPSLPTDKDLYRVSRTGERPTYPLERLYVVEEGRLRRERPTPGEVVRNLVGHTYTHRLLEEATLDEHFDQCARLLDSATMWRLYRPSDLAALPEAVDLLRTNGR